MKSPETPDRLDTLLIEYAVENIDWPDSEEELDRYLRAESSAVSTPAQAFLFDVDSGDSSDHNRPGSSASLGQIVGQAYLEVFDGHSIDRLIADPDPNARFIQSCWRRGAQASQYELNHLLLNARKNKIIGKVEGVKRYSVPRNEMDKYLFASEFALRRLQDEEYFENQRFVSLDRVLCDPVLAQRFEGLARSIMPGFSSLDYRWAAISIRKGQNRRATKNDLVTPTFERLGSRDSIRASRLDRTAGFFWLAFEQADLYIGHTENLREQIERVLDLRWDWHCETPGLFGIGNLRKAEFAIAPYPGVSPSNREALKTSLVVAKEPKLNVLKKGLCVA